MEALIGHHAKGKSVPSAVIEHVAGKAAWVRLFDETMAALRFKVDLPGGEQDLTSAEVFNLLSDKDGAVRKAAAKSIGGVLGDNARVFTLITNTLAKDKEIEDKWRRFARPVSSRNLSNFVEDEVVDALVAAEKWSKEPTEEHRRNAERAAEQTKYKDPSGWIALAAFWSGGSLAPPDQPEVAPAAHLTAKAITGALMLAATHGDPLLANGRYHEFLSSRTRLLLVQEAC